MQSGMFKIIKFINYKTLSLWDVKRYVQEYVSFNNGVMLRRILTPSIEPVTKGKMMQNNWQIISKINFAGELFLRDKTETETFKGNLNIVNPDSIIYSKINVRHGCIYYHPIGSIPFAVSSEYPVYKFDSKRICGDYLVMVIQSATFKSILSKKTTGISKARIKPAVFLETEIPVPDLSTQKQLLQEYNSSIKESSYLEQEGIKIQKELDKYLLDKLNVSNTSSSSSSVSHFKFIKFYRLKKLSRWDLYNKKIISQSNKYKNITLSDVVISRPQYGAAYSSKVYDGITRYIRITDINEDGTLNDNKVSAENFSENYLLKENDFLIARSGNTVGKTFIYKESQGKAIYAGYLIRFELDASKIIPEYLLAYTKSSIYKQWIKGNMRVSAQPNINSQQYLDSPVILPPVNIQKEIVEHVNQQMGLARSLKKQACFIREEALKKFETAIFK